MNKSKLTEGLGEAEISAPPEVVALSKRVEKLLADRHKTAKWLFETVGMSKAGWNQMWANGSVKLSVVYRIAKALDMTVAELLGQAAPLSTVQEPGATYGARPKYLEERVEVLEREIQALRKQLSKR